ncbi:MAG TPA: CocE/NonD family hydrolase, partial [Acidimicrobiales bacterium]|nr:CocE/NonD family hydrolase [Acidimicrobiales bacterium]
WLYLPGRAEGAAPGPGIVMAHGFSATKEMGLDGYAAVFRQAGLAVLAYDHRSLGASDGEPRQVINPWAQARDYRRALDWLAARPEVDERRLGVWGSSYSGGEALVVGAVDDRVRAIVANVPFVGMFGDRDGADERYAVLRDALLDEEGGGPADATEEPTGPFAVVSDATDGDSGLRVFLPQPESAAWFVDVGRRPGTRWQNRVWLRRAFGTTPPFDPSVAIAHLRAPLLMVVATRDDVADSGLGLQAFELAREPKELVMIDGDHYAPYSGDGLARASTAARDFLLRWI